MDEGSLINIVETRTLVNLGSGRKKFEGFINIDSDPETKPDIVADIREVKKHFEPDTVDEVHMYHVIEHLTQPDAVELLKDIFSVLKPGGLIAIECPNIIKCAVNLLQATVDGDKDRIERFGLLGLYGDPSYNKEAMLHRWGYWPEYLGGVLDELGYANIQEEVPQTKDFAAHKRDMRLVGFKF